MAMLLFAPAVAAGFLAARFLFRRGLRWTWTIPPLIASAAVAPFFGPGGIARYVTAVESAATGGAAWPGVAATGWVVWLLAVPASAAICKLWGDRRARLHGGAREQALRHAQGPRDILRRHLARKRERCLLTRVGDAGLLLGESHSGHPLRLPPLNGHATILGASNSGKTNTAQVLLEGHAATGAGFVVLDGKGGRDLPRTALRLAERHGRRAALWSVLPYGDPELDAHRLPWNPVGNATPTEAKDRIAATEDQEEPYYRAVASRGLLVAAVSIGAEGKALTLAELAKSLENPAAIATACAFEPGFEQDAEWLEHLTEPEKSALRGMATRLRTMIASDGGPALTHRPEDPHIDLLTSITRGDLVVFTLPQGAYPELVPHVARYVLQSLSSVCTRIEQGGTTANALVFVDELSAFDGDQLCAGFERGRSAGVRFVVATQSLSNLATAGGDKLLHAALDNAELLVIHRQAVPEAVELLASIAGTEEAWEHTHQVSDQIGRPIGWDETGVRARRLTDRFRAHPNVIKQLAQGEAVLVTHRPRLEVRQVRVRPFAAGTPNVQKQLC
jgi:hypothetical protein